MSQYKTKIIKDSKHEYTENELRKHFGLPAITQDKVDRRCLRCDKEFTAQSKFIFLCSSCYKASIY